MEAPVLLAATLAVSLGAMSLLWLLSLALRDASIVDVWWGPGFAVIAATACGLSSDGDPVRRGLVVGLSALWGLRLGGYLLWRNWGRGEDSRYRAMRRHHGDRFRWVSLGTVFGLQGTLMWLVSLPLQVAQLGPPTGLGPLDAIGVALFATGFVFESVGDLQLARFKADPANAGCVMDRGLWRYTRHPNYFGDFLVWWGFGALALGAPGGVFALLGPALMTVFLLRVSGVALLERSIGKRRPAYADYARRTSAFFPLPPRRPAAPDVR